jgi:hypothetical protein
VNSYFRSAISYRIAQKGLSIKVIIEQRPEKREGIRNATIWGRFFSEGIR